MSDSADVFTLKMRCHEYERRLAAVDLGGVDGEALHDENQALKTTVDELKAKLSARQTEAEELRVTNESLVEITSKLKSALEGLQSSNAELKSAIAAKTSELEWSQASEKSLSDQLGEAKDELVALKKKHEDWKNTAKERHKAVCLEVKKHQRENSLAEQRNDELEGQLAKYRKALVTFDEHKRTKNAAVEARSIAEDELAVQKANCIKAEGEVHELRLKLAETLKTKEREMEEGERDTAKKLALEGERMRQECEDKCHELELVVSQRDEELKQCKSLSATYEAEAAKLREKSELLASRLKKNEIDLAAANAQLDQAERKEAAARRDIIDAAESRVEQAVEAALSEAASLREGLRAELARAGERIDELRDKLRETRDGAKSAKERHSLEMEKMRADYDRLKLRWQNSVGAKRRAAGGSRPGPMRATVTPPIAPPGDKENPGSDGAGKVGKKAVAGKRRPVVGSRDAFKNKSNAVLKPAFR